MIQPVIAFHPQAQCRGKNTVKRVSLKGNSVSPKIALANAASLSAFVGGLGAIVARKYTANWAQALVLGIGGSVLSMFFMAPQILSASSHKILAKKSEAEIVVKNDAANFKKALKEHFTTAKKTIHFKQQV